MTEPNHTAISSAMPKHERPSEIVVNAGLRLRAAREHIGLTQAILARELGVGATAITNWEHGTRLVDVLAMVRLYQRFGITLEWIYAGQLGGLPYDIARDLELRSADLGAVVGAPAAEWPMEVQRRPGMAGQATIGRVPKRPADRLLNEPESPWRGPVAGKDHNT